MFKDLAIFSYLASFSLPVQKIFGIPVSSKQILKRQTQKFASLIL
jgi:hypothetical protein